MVRHTDEAGLVDGAVRGVYLQGLADSPFTRETMVKV